jgi:serine/threonine-protein kinase
MDRAGKVLNGKYELVAPAGRGGMAMVWRGVARGAAGFCRCVAIKRMLSNLVRDPQFVALFVEEARVGSQLQHPNIVTVEDFGQDDAGEYFLVSEWVEGIDFGRYVQGFVAAGSLPPWPLVAAIALEVLRGLRWAHDRVDSAGLLAPVFHRDLTPGNILIGLNGTAKLADFGLARSMDRDRITDPDIVKGKLSYLAPELTLGENPTVQSDLYSLGVVLWEALAGRKMFDGHTDVQVFLGVREGLVPPLADLRPDLPAELTATIHRALARRPADRFPFARAMARELSNLLRTTTHCTDAEELAESVTLARQWLDYARQADPRKADQSNRAPL